MLKSRASFVAWTALLIGSIVAGICVFYFLRIQLSNENAARFEKEADLVYANILERNGLFDYAQTLLSLRGLFVLDNDIERKEFDTFIENSNFFKTFPAIQSFSFIKKVTDAEKKSFIQSAAHSNNYQNFAISPEGTREEYYVITYINSLEKDMRPLGSDLFADPAKKQVLERSRDTNEFDVTELFSLNEKKLFSVVLPLYRKGASIATLDERRADIIGFVSLSIDPDKLIERTLGAGELAKNRRLDFYEITQNESGNLQKLFYEYNDSLDKNKNSVTRSFDFTIGNTHWIFSVTEEENRELTNVEKNVPFFFGIGIFLALLFIGGLVLMTSSAKNQAIIAVRQLSKNLKEVERYLGELSDNIEFTIDENGFVTSMNDAALHLLGFSLEDIVGIPLRESGIIATNSIQRIMETIGRTLRGETTSPIELELKKQSGTKIIAEAFITKMRGSGIPAEALITIHNITTRKNAENELTQSVAKFKKYAEESLDAILIIANKSIVYANSESAVLFRHSKKEFTGIKLDALVACESKQTINADLRWLAREGFSHESECVFLTKEKNRIYSIISMARVQWNNSNAILLVIKDVSLRKKLEQRTNMENAIAKTIAESPTESNVAQKLLENITTAFHWQLGDIWMYNKTADKLEIFDLWKQPGYNLNSLEKRTRELTFKKGEGLPGKVLKEGKPKWIVLDTKLEFKRKKEMEEAGLITAFAFPLVVEQTIIGVVEFFTDMKIEEMNEKLIDAFTSVGSSLGQFLRQHQSNKEIRKNLTELQKFKLALEWIEDSVVITDEEGIVQYSNKAAEKINGYSQNEILGKKAGKLWGGLMPKEFYADMWNTIKMQQKPFKGEIHNHRKNGEKYTSMVNISPVFDEHGAPKFFVGTERDITQEKEIDRAKTEFVSLASHQLRTPITAINWYSELILGGDAGQITKTQRSYLEEINNGGRRLVALVNSLLNVSRIELGTIIVAPKPTNVVLLCESAIKDISLPIKTKKIEIVKDFALDVPLMNIDPGIMQIIFQNIITNAVEYTLDGGSVNVTLKKDGDNLFFSVSDTGIGIPVAEQSKIFTKLFRADNAREIKTYGTGLGLYLIKSIIEQNNGKIWFISAENKGTTFFVTFPLSGMKPKEGTKMLSIMKDVI